MQSKYADLLNRLDAMQQSPYYATARATLADAVRTIVALEAALAEKSEAARKPAARGTRLSRDWRLPASWGQWALDNVDGWTVESVRREAEVFRDYWVAKTGQGGTKLDWEATWRNWMRKARPNGGNGLNGHGGGNGKDGHYVGRAIRRQLGRSGAGDIFDGEATPVD